MKQWKKKRLNNRQQCQIIYKKILQFTNKCIFRFFYFRLCVFSVEVTIISKNNHLFIENIKKVRVSTEKWNNCVIVCNNSSSYSRHVCVKKTNCLWHSWCQGKGKSRSKDQLKINAAKLKRTTKTNNKKREKTHVAF